MDTQTKTNSISAPADERERIGLCLSRIVEWYQASRRVLPWREDPTPYQVWVSEIMLQQTRIEAVLGYYRRFMEALPTVQALAEAEEDRLLKLWEGLGYYSRARNLQKTARLLVEHYGGKLPETAAELRKLPGIGDYTAGAIASIAYGQPESAVDGNVLRVLSRILASDEDIMQPATRRRMAALLREQYPSGEAAGLLTEGLMELGETLCVPKGEARCALCPVRTHCLAHAQGRTADYPVKAAPRPRRIEERTVLLLRCGKRFAIRRREDRGLLAGLWEFPNEAGRPDEQTLRAALEARGARILAMAPCGAARHVFTHVEWQMLGWLVDCAEPWGEFLWLRADEIAAGYSIPTAFRAYQKLLEAKE